MLCCFQFYAGTEYIDDFVSLMTLVTRNVANHSKVSKTTKDLLIHIPTIVSTLRFNLKLPIKRTITQNSPESDTPTQTK